MTELSSTGEASSADSPSGFRRSTLPAPPRPPAPLDQDGGFAGVFGDGGPATSAMTAVPDDLAEDTKRGYLAGSSYASFTGSGSPAAEQLTGIGALPPTPGPVRSYETKPGRKDRRPQVSVRGPRRAKLVVRRVDPWSVMKFSFLFSVCMAIMFVVSASAVLSLLRTMHVFDNINSVLVSATSPDSTTTKSFRVAPTFHDVRLWAAILGAVNALLFTALATLGAFLYNLISMLVGGVEVTLAERD